MRYLEITDDDAKLLTEALVAAIKREAGIVGYMTSPYTYPSRKVGAYLHEDRLVLLKELHKRIKS